QAVAVGERGAIDSIRGDGGKRIAVEVVVFGCAVAGVRCLRLGVFVHTAVGARGHGMPGRWRSLGAAELAFSFGKNIG
ncbi:hypothetical protein, partial [Salinisphaera sp. C84B14]|uniref:hypothetical protein n=1 Tax=Salinisphaera sp. C84B14 TaxID=1304155 RepID=UPI00333E7DAD